MLGFTYNGVHSSEFGLYCVRTPDEKWFNDPEYEVYDDDIRWKHGGYYYTSKAKVRVFTIKCFFEEIDVSTRQKIKQWVKMGTSGQLIFDDMPFVYWNVHPGKIPVGNWYLDNAESHSGTVTITFNAYDPFGYLTRKYNTQTTPDDGAEDYCYLIDINEMPSEPTTSSRSFEVYNPGTEECGLSIDISGSVSHPIRFFNDANRTECILNALPAGNARLYINGETGYVYLVANNANGFLYHEHGFVKLNPCVSYKNKNFRYLGTNGTTYTFSIDGVQARQLLIGGQMIISGLSNTIFTVESVNVGQNRIYCTRYGSGTPSQTGTCDLNTMNKIWIQELVNDSWVTPTTLSINSILIDYMPRVL